MPKNRVAETPKQRHRFLQLAGNKGEVLLLGLT